MERGDNQIMSNISAEQDIRIQLIKIHSQLESICLLINETNKLLRQVRGNTQ